MEDDVKKQISELRALLSMEMLPKETKGELEMTIGLLESLEKYENNKDETQRVTIKYINKSNNKNPVYAKEGDSGFDLRANVSGTLKTLERTLVSTGLFFELPKGYELQIRPRSGMAYKNGVTVLNTPGTVDRGYSGEIKIILINLSNKTFKIKHGDRIAQAVVSPVLSGRWCNLNKQNELNKTKRGDGGFGSTGTN